MCKSYRGFLWLIAFGLVPVLPAGGQVRLLGTVHAENGRDDGILGMYHEHNRPSVAPFLIRIDPSVDLVWERNSPYPNSYPPGFFVRWAGELGAPVTDTYTLILRADGYSGLWIDGETIVDFQYRGAEPVETEAAIELVAGQRYQIEVEHRPMNWSSIVQLLWQTVWLPRQVVPARGTASAADGPGALPAESGPGDREFHPAMDGWAVAVGIPLSGPVHIGLYVASNTYYVSTAAEFSRVEISGGISDSWQVAAVSMSGETNPPERLYVALEDAAGAMAVVGHPDPHIVNVTEWTQCKIPQRDFTDAGVDMRAIRRMYIGLGDRDHPQPGGSGRIYIDDIRVVKKEAETTGRAQNGD
jgi:hypothetical protein